MLTVTIALAPIVLASVIQGMERAKSDTAEVHGRLIETAREAGNSEENMLAAAEQIARALANLPSVRDADENCSRALADALKGLSFFTNISRIDEKGRIICAANPLALDRDVSARPVWKQAMAGREFVLSERIVSPLTNQPVISGMLPLLKNGTAIGVIAISIDVRWLDYMVRTSRLPEGSVVAIFDQKGTMIAANDTGVAGKVFAHPVLGANEVQSAPDAAGNIWTYATAPLLGRDVFVGFAMRQSSLFGATYIHVGTDFILPILMIVLTWLAIWIGTERQVTRWIVQLRRISLAYRSGHYAIRPSLEGAPLEFRQLGEALSAMADSIQERDRHLREAVAQKSVLVREVHHRVKNNLQIVMSLLNLQAARVRDASAQSALKQAQLRINTLALVHRTLHEIEDQSLVQLDRLLADLTQRTCEVFGGEWPGLQVETVMAPRLVQSHIAVPLALFTTEALTNIFKHAYPAAGAGRIRVVLKPAGSGELSLSVEDDGVGFDTAGEKPDASIGAQLIATFAQQIGGRVITRSTSGMGTIVELRFPEPGTGEQT
jgi:two-component sensor histidine kinase